MLGRGGGGTTVGMGDGRGHGGGRQTLGTEPNPSGAVILAQRPWWPGVNPLLGACCRCSNVDAGSRGWPWLPCWLGARSRCRCCALWRRSWPPCLATSKAPPRCAGRWWRGGMCESSPRPNSRARRSDWRRSSIGSPRATRRRWRGSPLALISCSGISTRSPTPSSHWPRVVPSFFCRRRKPKGRREAAIGSRRSPCMSTC